MYRPFIMLYVQTSPLPVTTLSTSSPGSKLDPKICPSDPDLIAYVSNSDIWLYDLFTHTEHRLTYSHKGQQINQLR